MITRCQSKWEIQAIWRLEPNSSHVPAGILLLFRMAGEAECSLEHLGPAQATGADSSGKGQSCASARRSSSEVLQLVNHQ